MKTSLCKLDEFRFLKFGVFSFGYVRQIVLSGFVIGNSNSFAKLHMALLILYFLVVCDRHRFCHPGNTSVYAWVLLH